MFMTLLKHEWRATRGVLGLMCLIILSAGTALGCCGLCFTQVDALNPFVETTIYLLVLASIIAIAVCCVGGVFYLIWRFYCSRFTDEGYLTFTLPVSTHQNLLSSIANILWGCVLILLAALAAMLIVFFLLTVPYMTQIDWVNFPALMGQLWTAICNMLDNSWQNLLWALGSAVFSGISTVILFMLAVTVGSIIAKKHKILAAVGAYWLISFVRNSVFVVGLLGSESGKWILQYPLYVSFGIALVGYFVMYYLVDKKLNLN